MAARVRHQGQPPRGHRPLGRAHPVRPGRARQRRGDHRPARRGPPDRLRPRGPARRDHRRRGRSHPLPARPVRPRPQGDRPARLDHHPRVDDRGQAHLPHPPRRLGGAVAVRRRGQPGRARRRGGRGLPHRLHRFRPARLARRSGRRAAGVRLRPQPAPDLRRQRPGAGVDLPLRPHRGAAGGDGLRRPVHDLRPRRRRAADHQGQRGGGADRLRARRAGQAARQAHAPRRHHLRARPGGAAGQGGQRRRGRGDRARPARPDRRRDRQRAHPALGARRLGQPRPQGDPDRCGQRVGARRDGQAHGTAGGRQADRVRVRRRRAGGPARDRRLDPPQPGLGRRPPVARPEPHRARRARAAQGLPVPRRRQPARGRRPPGRAAPVRAGPGGAGDLGARQRLERELRVRPGGRAGPGDLAGRRLGRAVVRGHADPASG